MPFYPLDLQGLILPGISYEGPICSPCSYVSVKNVLEELIKAIVFWVEALCEQKFVFFAIPDLHKFK